MAAGEVFFPKVWFAFDLGQYRPGVGTYSQYDYAKLPPLDERLFDGQLSWLPFQQPAEMELQNSEAIAPIVAECAAKSLVLPPAFLKLIHSPELMGSIPSCTACYFELSTALTPSNLGDGGYFLRFMNDQQCVLLWYLYLTPDGQHSVMVSRLFIDEVDDELRDDWQSQTFFTAPSFEAFLYRFWLENTIWYTLHPRPTYALDKTPIFSPVQQAYLDYCQSSKA